jgi:predicted phage terminase large subunit-like protein
MNDELHLQPLDLPPQLMDFTQLEELIGPDAYKMTPATLANKVSHGEWIAAPHLLLLSAKIANRLAKGNARLIISLPPRHGKPLFVDEKVLMGDGSYKRLGDIVVGDEVITHKSRARKVVAVHEQGRLPTVKIKTRMGRCITAALDHPFLTKRGWIKAGELRLSDKLALITSIEKESYSSYIPEEFRLAGYFAGDGACSWNQNGASCNANITCADEEQLKDIYHCVTTLNFTIRYSCRYNYQLADGIRDWLRKVTLAGKDCYTKEVPQWVFESPVDLALQFVGAYFACDGSIDRLGPQRTPTPSFCSVSLKLLQGVQSILLRAGINSNISDSAAVGYRLNIGRSRDIKLFMERVPIYGVKSLKLKTLVEQFFAEKPRKITETIWDTYLDDEVKGFELQDELFECRCLTVEEDETFTVQDVIVHNSELISHWTSVWALMHYQHWEIILASYGADLATDFGRKVRDTITADCDPYEGEHLLGIELKEDAQQVGRWMTKAGGGMKSVGIGGALYGRGAHLLLVDDYFKNPEEAMSEAHRDKVFEWFSTIAMTRLAPGGSAIIIATRWHKDDLSGRLLALPGSEWEEIQIPVRIDTPEQLAADLLGRQMGEVLWPARYSAEAIASLEATMTSYFFSAIMQQQPKPAASASFNPKNVTIVDVLPDIKFLKNVRSWDLAGTQDGGDWTVGTGVAKDIRNNDFYIWDCKRKQLAPGGVKSLVEKTMDSDGKGVKVVIEQEPGSAGKAVIDSYVSENPAYSVHGTRHTGDKMTRLDPFLAAVEHGRVYMLRASWNQPMLDELVEMPDGKHDDQADTLSQGYNELFEKKAKAGTFGREGNSSIKASSVGSGEVVHGVTFGRKP